MLIISKCVIEHKWFTSQQDFCSQPLGGYKNLLPWLALIQAICGSADLVL